MGRLTLWFILDTSDLHSLLKPHQSSDYIVDFKILHFSVVGVEGAIKIIRKLA